MKILAWCSSWILFWIGDLASRTLNVYYTDKMHVVYTKLMNMSADIQDKYKVDAAWNKKK